MNTNKGLAPIIAVIIAVIIIAGGIGGYLYIKNKNKLLTATPSNIPTLTKQNISTSPQTNILLDISTWKNLDSDYVSLKYPNDWTTRISPSKEFITVLNSDRESGLLINVVKIAGSNKTQESVCSYYKQVAIYLGSISNEREIKIDNLSGKAYEAEDKNKISKTEVCLGTQNYVYDFVFNPNVSNIYLSKMLDTIKIKLK